METPQLENGYTKIANEILEQLSKTVLSSYEWQVIMCVFRKTYGYNKKSDKLPVSQIVTMTGIHKSHVSRTIKKLSSRGIVTRTGNSIAFNKNYLEWLPKQVTNKKLPKQVTEVTQIGNKKLPKQADSKEKKETIQKKEKEKNEEAQKYLDTFNEVYGTKYGSISSLIKNYNYWRKEYSLEEIIRAVKRSKNVFWAKQPTPQLLLRTRNKNGDCDYIGEILNTKSKDELELSGFIVKE